MIALALLVASPTALHFGDPIGNVSEWIRNSDNAQTKANGAVLFKVIFNPEGRPDRCIIVKRVGDETVEPLVCGIIFKRFRSQSSLGADGKPTYMIFQRSAVFMTGGGSKASLKEPPLVVVDMTGTLAPKDDGKRMALAVAVDRKGAIIACAPTQWARGKEIALVEAACRSLPASWKPIREVNATNEPIEYLRGVEIEFRRVSASVP